MPVFAAMMQECFQNGDHLEQLWFPIFIFRCAATKLKTGNCAINLIIVSDFFALDFLLAIDNLVPVKEYHVSKAYNSTNCWIDDYVLVVAKVSYGNHSSCCDDDDDDSTIVLTYSLVHVHENSM